MGIKIEDENDIRWNFTKFIVNRKGEVVKRFEPTDSMSDVEAFVKDIVDLCVCPRHEFLVEIPEIYGEKNTEDNGKDLYNCQNEFKNCFHSIVSSLLKVFTLFKLPSLSGRPWQAPSGGQIQPLREHP